MIEVRNLKKSFRTGLFRKKLSKVINGVSFNIGKGEILGLVGESGCGKTTLGRLMARLISPTEGKVIFKGRDIFKVKKREFRKLRPKIQMVFQNPDLALNPRMRIRESLAEPLKIQNLYAGKEREEKVFELLEMVGLNREHLERYPHELSGGQIQRAVLTRILPLKPEFVILDEPTSSLDVSVQAQILNLLGKLRDKLGLTYLLISHDLDVVRIVSERIMVMYLGGFVEAGNREQIFNRAVHPYTRALVSASFDSNLTGKRKIILDSEVPSSLNPPAGCRFHPRCPEAKKICSRVEPLLKDSGNGHLVACHLI